MELLPWIKFHKLSNIMLNSNSTIGEFMNDSYILKDWFMLSENPSVVSLLFKNQDKISVTLLLSNPNPKVLPLIKSKLNENPNLPNILFQSNPNTFELIRMNEIHWPTLCSNTHPKAIALLQQMIDDGRSNELDWNILSTNPAAISILETNQDKIIWKTLSSNPAAMHLLLEHQDKIKYMQLCKNTHPLAIELIKELPKEWIYWPYLSANPSAIDFLEENQEYINWYYLSLNPAIFRYNYPKMANIRNQLIYEELLSVALHPSRISNWIKQGVILSEI